jgi:hypothetical protein
MVGRSPSPNGLQRRRPCARRAARRAGDPDGGQGEWVTALPAPRPPGIDPREHPTLEPSLGR